jgi:uncharacterized repeat protein (TIGR03803 family)
MFTTRFFPLALVLGSLTTAQAQYKAIFNFGAPGNPSCTSNETIAQTPGGNLISTDHSGCTTSSWTSANKPAAYEIGFQGANFTILQQFTEPWESPYGGLTLGTDQRYHGTVNEGGTRNHGMVYRLSPTGAIVVQHDFEGGADGGYPWAAPIQGADGAFYGTTAGASSAYAGTVYKIDTTGHYSVLHLFTTTDGRAPINSLVQGSDLNFYGTTLDGGLNGLGTFFRISSTGVFAVVHDFDSTDGSSPIGPLIQASDGNFYAAIYGDGATNFGSVVKLTPAGTETVVYRFSAADGFGPQGGIIQATDGNFYGTLWQGGAAGCGALFSLTRAGVFTKLHDFRQQSGCTPQNTIMQHTSGKLYGTTWSGGTNNDGVIWEYDPGLAPFVTFLNVYGQVGAKVYILGEYFASNSVVSFNGVAAQNPVIQPTYIQATVPAGATTGFITVTTSKGTLKSNKPFVVH